MWKSAIFPVCDHRNSEASRDSKDRLVEGASDGKVQSRGRAHAQKIVCPERRMGDDSYTKSLALTWLGEALHPPRIEFIEACEFCSHGYLLYKADYGSLRIRRWTKYITV